MGTSLVPDEFALILHLQDAYWSGEGQLSVQVVTLMAACLGLALVGFSPYGVQAVDSVELSLRLSATSVLLIDGVLAVICALRANTARRSSACSYRRSQRLARRASAGPRQSGPDTSTTASSSSAQHAVPPSSIADGYLSRPTGRTSSAGGRLRPATHRLVQRLPSRNHRWARARLVLRNRAWAPSPHAGRDAATGS